MHSTLRRKCTNLGKVALEGSFSEPDKEELKKNGATVELQSFIRMCKIPRDTSCEHNILWYHYQNSQIASNNKYCMQLLTRKHIAVFRVSHPKNMGAWRFDPSRTFFKGSLPLKALKSKEPLRKVLLGWKCQNPIFFDIYCLVLSVSKHFATLLLNSFN